MIVTLKDNSIKVLQLAEKAKKKALFAIGTSGEKHIKEIITDEGRVDTGRMRNSAGHKEDENATYIGVNTDYAIYNEMGTTRMSGIHMVQRAATNYTSEYKGIAEDAGRNA